MVDPQPQPGAQPEGVSLPPQPASPAPGQPAPGQPLPEPKPYDWGGDPLRLRDVQLGDYRLAGKYGSVEDLEKAYTAAQGLIGKKSGELAKELGYFVPEAYEFGDAAKEWDQQTAQAVQAEFRALGLSQDQAAKALPKLVEMADALNTANSKKALMDEWNLTGPAFEGRLDQVGKWGAERLPTDVYERFRGMGVHGVLAVEALMKAGTEMPVWGGGGGATPQDLKGELAALESKLYDAQHPLPHEEYQRLTTRRQEIYSILYPAGKAA